jgi:hypothetical protein
VGRPGEGRFVVHGRYSDCGFAIPRPAERGARSATAGHFRAASEWTRPRTRLAASQRNFLPNFLPDWHRMGWSGVTWHRITKRGGLDDTYSGRSVNRRVVGSSPTRGVRKRPAYTGLSRFLSSTGRPTVYYYANITSGQERLRTPAARMGSRPAALAQTGSANARCVEAELCSAVDKSVLLPSP